ncbi:MAG: hypothetical protein AVDCRST_MAG09-425 [uncultured Sphingomonas sp.]|uniref:Uncharacterized protein n=1 Tax=uncultured Sphingomonas sp. TaxID=158754 RepID=A0A6J4SEN6_9SPHN|nr:hypothetical protein [uncultured Sphingomonas sp.]CAA9496299.1 MAG: hypothetical protein AVDCRST_MAG09-425 [uncultured Sphingomonas sp.]
MNVKTSLFAAVAALLVSTATVGSAVAPATGLQLPVGIAASA